MVIEPYRGYGSSRELYLMGRVYRQPGGPVRGLGRGNDLLASLSRLLRWGKAGQAITARFADTEQRVVSDRDGYFYVHLPLTSPPPGDTLWHRVELTLELPSGAHARARGEVFVPPQQARYVVISDIDDTVMYTGVASKLRMLWNLFAQGAESRVAFPGVAALYRALHGKEQNPILYVSRAPWSIYSMLEAFFQLHRIPVGPVLFLREWGLSLQSPLPRRARGHKLELIRNMLALYRDLPFVLIGDSGQHDPETYAQVVREHPGRIAAVYIRNVSRQPERVAAIEALATEVVAAGSSLLLAADSVAIAEHAAQQGLVPAATVDAVASERRPAVGAARPQPTRKIGGRGRRQAQRAVARGEVSRSLQQADDAEPPNTLIEPGRKQGELRRR